MRGSEEGGRRKGRQARRGRRSGDTALSSCQGSEPFPNRPARHFPSGPQNGFRFCVHSIHLYRGRSGNGQKLCTLSQEVIEFILGRKEMFVCICNAFVCICNVFYVYAHVSVGSSTSEPIVSTPHGAGVVGAYMTILSLLCGCWRLELGSKCLLSKHF